MNPVSQGIDILQGDNCPYGMLYLAITEIRKVMDVIRIDCLVDPEDTLQPLVKIIIEEIDLR